MPVSAARDVDAITRITRDTDAHVLALAVYDQLLALLDQLDPEDWDRRVPDCPAWTVADTVGHLIGAARSHASPIELVRQLAIGHRRRGAFDGNATDATNDLQVRDHAHLTPGERIATLRRLAPRAVAGRMRTPGVVRRRSVPIPQSGSWGPDDPDTLQLGHLMDAVLTRDVWMHRLDLARATGHTVRLDAAADRRVVEDVVAEWAHRHGQPLELVLTGPAGGVFLARGGGPRIELDASTLCRTVSGREPGEGLLATHVLF